MTAVAVRKAKEITVFKLPDAELTTTGLHIVPGTDAARLKEIAEQITRVGTGYQWWLADMLVYAHHNLKVPADFEQMLMELTGFGAGYLKQMLNTAKKYPHRDRQPISFAHHVAALRITSHASRIKALKVAVEKKISLTRFTERYAKPSGGPRAMIIFRVPVSLAKDKKFLAVCKKLCEEYEIQFYVAGTRRHTVARSAAGHGGKPMLTTTVPSATTPTR